jgi:predicted secreted protein
MGQSWVPDFQEIPDEALEGGSVLHHSTGKSSKTETSSKNTSLSKERNMKSSPVLDSSRKHTEHEESVGQMSMKEEEISKPLSKVPALKLNLAHLKKITSKGTKNLKIKTSKAEEKPRNMKIKGFGRSFNTAT